MYRLENWNFVKLRHYHLNGQVYGHPDFEDGTRIWTTRPIEASEDCVITLSGSEYELGEPDPEYIKWMEETHPNLDPNNLPLVVRSLSNEIK